MPHDFNSSLHYEQSKFSIQNRFYTNILHATDIRRADFNSIDGRALQRLDVDLQLTLNGQTFNVSEKNRTRDYGDLLLEFYSKFPDTVGWMNNTNADFLAYFVPGKVYWINKRELEFFYKKYLEPHIPNEYFEMMVSEFPNTSRKEVKEVTILGRSERVTVVQAYNRPFYQNTEWYTESICVTFACLRRAGVEIKEYSI